MIINSHCRLVVSREEILDIPNPLNKNGVTIGDKSGKNKSSSVLYLFYLLIIDVFPVAGSPKTKT
jgi:hypothetical protein